MMALIKNLVWLNAFFFGFLLWLNEERYYYLNIIVIFSNHFGIEHLFFSPSSITQSLPFPFF